MTEKESKKPSDQSLPDLQTALRLFDETTRALDARAARLEQVLTRKQAELVETNQRLTQQIAATERLRSRLDSVLGSITSGVIAIDLEGRIQTANASAFTILGRNDLIGLSYETLFPDRFLIQIDNTGPVRKERTYQGPDGVHRILSSTATLLHHDGQRIGAVEALEDVTKLRQLTERLERAGRLEALGEMAAGVAHEIRNPLHGIEGYASMLLRDLPAEGSSHRYASSIVQGVRHLNSVVAGLLAFTRPQKPTLRPMDPIALAQAVVDLASAAMEAAPSRQHQEGASDVARLVPISLINHWTGPAVELDPQQIHQVLLNLIRNAQEAIASTEKTGAVQLSVESIEESLSFIVDDNGPGVPESERRKIFLPFHTTRPEGTGLGLAIASTLVNLHGGSLDVGDSPLGGARFTVRLPIERHNFS